MLLCYLKTAIECWQSCVHCQTLAAARATAVDVITANTNKVFSSMMVVAMHSMLCFTRSPCLDNLSNQNAWW